MALPGQKPTKFKVALVQMRPEPNNPEANFTHASNQIRRAVSSDTISLAILPEYHLTGFDPSSPKFIPCCQTSHIYIERYQSLARELHINICPGTIVLTPEPEDAKTKVYSMQDDDRPTLLNTSFFIDPEGKILGSYTKTNLWHPEREHLTSSIEHSRTRSESESKSDASSLPPALASMERQFLYKHSAHEEALPQPHQVIETDLGPVGILICWDLAFPEAFRSLIFSGAKIILIPTFWMFTDMSEEGRAYNATAEKLFLQTTLTSRAFENTCAVVFCNAGGPEDEGYIGVSQVTLPIVGPVEGSFAGAKEGVGIAEIDAEILEVAERNYKVREDIQRSDWHYGYEKVLPTTSTSI